MKKFVLFLFVAGFLASCLPPQNNEITLVKLDLKDPVYRQVINLQDKQELDSLYLFLKHVDPSYRYAAAMAFGSIKNQESLDSLLPLLDDNIPVVRTAAAFALGQLKNEKAQESLINAFNSIDTLSANNSTNAAILSAVGHCAEESYLNSLATVSTYRPTDTLLLFGQAKAIFNYSLRGLTDEKGTERMMEFLCGDIYPKNVRLIAGAYIKRAKDLDLKKYTFRLNRTFQKETDPSLKMDLAFALGITGDAEILPSLLTELNNKGDYRIKVNIIRNLGRFTYIDVVETVLEKTKDPNIHIASTAAQFLVDNGQPNDVIIYRKYAKGDLRWQVKSKIYEAIIKHVPIYFSKTKSASLWDVRRNIESSSDPYEKAAYILALGNDLESIDLIKTAGFDSNELPARIAAVEALNKLIERKDLEEVMNRYQFGKFKANTAMMIRQAFESGDGGMIALGAIGFKNCSFELKSEYENLEFITAAKNKLLLPADIEIYNEILKLEAWLNKTEFKPNLIGYNHPINWKIFDRLSDNAKAIIETNKGNFEILLLKNNAPASVVNFVDLAEKGYFEGKRFHRVVPNFVIQTGCSRGDGWGSLDYTIRSELSMLNYDDEAFVGMASAGNHTESSQWFVTHSATLHLDGNYTIFGKVKKGMKTVHDIQIGDIMESVKIIY